MVLYLFFHENCWFFEVFEMVVTGKKGVFFLLDFSKNQKMEVL
jgi:hypothetical protein